MRYDQRSAVLSDYRRYSRARIEEGILGEEYEARCRMMRAGNAALLSALWLNHPHVMLIAEECGRQVARP